MSSPLLRVKDLDVTIETEAGPALAAAGIGFDLHPGEMLALVGESGCGKSVTALALMRLLPTPPARITRGNVDIDGVSVLDLAPRALENLRGRAIGMIFQEPMTSLNPVLTIGRQMTEGLVRHFGHSKTQAVHEAEAALAAVRIIDPATVMRQHPHQLSGGMRQRVMIAAALALRPRILVADEPTTALDVTVQAQVLDLLAGLRDQGSAVLMITHDLGVVAETADQVAVMYAGRIVEYADVNTILEAPAHPYTRGLLASRLVPRIEPRAPGAFPENLPTIHGSVPPLNSRPSGCAFRDRCPKAIARCAAEMPSLALVVAAHEVACWRPFDA